VTQDPRFHGARFLLAALVANVSLFSAAAAPQTAAPGICEPSPEVRAELRIAAEKLFHIRPQEGIFEKSREIFRPLLEKHPEDLHVHRAFLNRVGAPGLAGQESLVNGYTALAASHKGNPAFEYLRAVALLRAGRREEARTILEGIASGSPSFPWAHFALAGLHARSKDAADRSKARPELEKFFSLCPDGLDGFSLAIEVDDAAFQQRAAERLRKRLQATTGDEDRYPVLWALEYKVTPNADVYRSRVIADIDRLRKEPLTVPRAVAILAGIPKLGATPEYDAMEDEVYDAYPTLAPTRRQQERWEKKNPRPGAGAPPEEIEEWARRLLSASRGWTAASPDDPIVWLSRIRAVILIKGLPVSEVEQAADGFLATLEKRPNSFSTTPPPRSQVAILYLAKGLRLPEARRLVEADITEAEKKDAEAASLSPELQQSATRRCESIRRACWPILVEACTRTGELPEARETLAKMQEALRRETSSPATFERERVAREGSKVEVLLAEAEIATAERRPSDALLALKKALVIAIAEESPGRVTVQDRAHKAFIAAGKRERDWSDWLAGATRLAGSPDPRRGWERPRHPLADFEMKDTAGKIWARASLKGKTVLINFWATWCGPCRAELPQIQSLWEAARSRKDLLILSFNTDRDEKLVEPFLKKNGYGFPVIFASAYFEKNAGEEKGIPQTWMISKSGDLVLAQSGYAEGDTRWKEKILALLEEVGRERPSKSE